MTAVELPRKPGDRRHWSNLPGAAATHAISEAITHHEGVTLVIAADTAGAQRLKRELSFFLGDTLP
ncbi:MAG: hypothetical protein HN816_11380, partial [Gammaproteobacteria bacterium]|nr:hypothetical protein [Gammaproteobacteria bacterium]